MESLVIIPTYNEKQNIESLIEALLNLGKQLHILIIDDNSPDGTGVIADQLAKKHQEVHVLHRKGKLGLGTAYVEGFKYALKSGAKYILQMDADFSHQPRAIPDFLEAIKAYDLVLGSRYYKGVRVMNWPFRRILLSKMGTKYVRAITGLPVTDITGGYKCFRREVLEAIDLHKIKSNGYSFMIEMTFKTYHKGFRIGEIPIVFEERRAGQSKISKSIIFEAMWLVWKLQIEQVVGGAIRSIKEAIYAVPHKQLIKFMIVGGIGFGVNMFVYYVTYHLLLLHYIASAVWAFSIAVTHNFLLNKFWTFRCADKKDIFVEYYKYVSTNVLGLGVNLLILMLLVSFLKTPALISQAIAICCAVVVNYAGSKLWVFKIKKLVKA